MTAAAGICARASHRIAGIFGASAFAIRRASWRMTKIGGVRGPSAALSSPAIIAPAMATAIAATAFLTLPYWAAPVRWHQLQEMHARSLAVEVEDSEHRWLGIVPAALDGSDTPPYKTVLAADVPEDFFNILVALEDRHLDKRTVHGHDVLRIFKLILLWAFGDADGGGSGLASQLARSLHAMTPGGKTPIWKRKLIELIDGAVLHRQLGGRNGSGFRRWLATHLPMVQGTYGSKLGGEIRGLSLTARILWNKRVQDLTLAELAVCAAAVRRHVLIAPKEDVATASLRSERWTKIKDRAATGLRLAYGDDNPRVRRALAELDRMPAPRPALDSRIASTLGADPSVRFRAAANPQARAATLALREIRQARKEIVAYWGPDYAREVASFRLGIDIVRNRRLSARIERALHRIATSYNERLMLDLTGDAEMLVAVADQKGVIRRFIASHQGVWTGAYQSGSVAKMPAAVLLGELGDSPRSLYCRKTIDGGAIRSFGRDPGVSGCGEPGALIPARTAFGKSDNLAIIEALDRVAPAHINETAERFGLALHNGVSPRIAVSIGLAEISPRDVMRMTQRIATLARTGNATAPLPRMTASVTMRTGKEASVSWKEPRMDSARTIALTETQRAFVRDVLAAPLSPGGTLSRLGRVMQGRVAWKIAKSGTVDTPGGNTKAKWITAAFESKGRLYTVVVLVTSPDSRPLGRGLGAAFTPLAVEAIRSIADEGENRYVEKR